MDTILIFFCIFIGSFLLALHSMKGKKKDHHTKHHSQHSKKGRIVLFKNKTVHYSSESSSSDSV